jgi:hypothetical protein
MTKLARVTKGGSSPILVGNVPPTPKRNQLSKSGSGKRRVGRGAPPLFQFRSIGDYGAIDMKRHTR